MEKEFKELSAKVDKILEMQELILNKLNQGVIISKEAVVSNSTQKKLSKKEEANLRVQHYMEEIELSCQYGGVFQRQFNLVVVPSADRIRKYLKTKDVKAFDGLKRNK